MGRQLQRQAVPRRRYRVWRRHNLGYRLPRAVAIHRSRRFVGSLRQASPPPQRASALSEELGVARCVTSACPRFACWRGPRGAVCRDWRGRASGRSVRASHRRVGRFGVALRHRRWPHFSGRERSPRDGDRRQRGGPGVPRVAIDVAPAGFRAMSLDRDTLLRGRAIALARRPVATHSAQRRRIPRRTTPIRAHLRPELPSVATG